MPPKQVPILYPEVRLKYARMGYNIGMEIEGKVCTKCDQWVSASGYTRSPKYAGGLNYCCKACTNKSARDRAKIKGYVRSDGHATVSERLCPKCKVQKSAAEFYSDKYRSHGLSLYCQECCKARISDRFQNDRERLLIISRERHRHNKDRENAQSRAYMQVHGPERERQYQEANPRWWRAYKNAKDNRRRVRKMGNGGTYTPDEWLALCASAENKCLCCGQERPLTADHIVPVSRGGSNFIENIQPLCKPCNSRKNTRIIDFR